MVLRVKNEDNLEARKGEKFRNDAAGQGLKLEPPEACPGPPLLACVAKGGSSASKARGHVLTKWTLAGRGLYFHSAALVCRPLPRHTQLVSDKFSSGLREGNAVQRERWPQPGEVPRCWRLKTLVGESLHPVWYVSGLRSALPSSGHRGSKHNSVDITVIPPLTEILGIFISHYSCCKYCKILFLFTLTSNYSCPTARRSYIMF